MSINLLDTNHEYENLIHSELTFISIIIYIPFIVLKIQIDQKQFLSKFKTNLHQSYSHVLRDSIMHQIKNEEILIGDILYFKKGDHITIDGILIKGHKVFVDESDILDISKINRKKNYNKCLNKKNKHHSFLILSGSFIYNGEGSILVCCVGKNSYFSKKIYKNQVNFNNIINYLN